MGLCGAVKDSHRKRGVPVSSLSYITSKARSRIRSVEYSAYSVKYIKSQICRPDTRILYQLAEIQNKLYYLTPLNVISHFHIPSPVESSQVGVFVVTIHTSIATTETLKSTERWRTFPLTKPHVPSTGTLENIYMKTEYVRGFNLCQHQW